ncbi:GGDEF domain-containing protein [Pseudomonas sp. JS3066]|jgi:diguanylate cyclase (GGDEF)-like protein|uniref:GGDEF domain-containing protein n=1 Tax=unclassified Pseudomonas TaxID=196821 RepID=UPI000EA8BB4E|nr:MULTISPECIES: GGDEF domain-containing protein [unclassified Pseudomonas]AYF89877.1 GGDEF domain-containing protein [Pseudomonas sp. DY-1]WVK92536.1 GGDEF domain-containing protein [Pseudomonas sp. JS3066]
MTDADLPHSPERFSLWREVQDTRTRTRLGGVYYLLAWLLCWLFSAAPMGHLAVGLLGSGFFALMLAARLLHHPPAEGSEAELQHWLDRHWGVILVSSIGWGLAHAWVLLAPDFHSSSLIGTLATIAFSTAMAFNFAMRRSRAIIAILLLYLPGLVVLGVSADGSRAELVTLTFYLSYLLLALNRSHREYGTMLALELQLLEQRQRLDTLSRTDGLTQLGNRYQFNNLFPAMCAAAQRHGSELSLLLMDIDFFKRINDEHGHSMGDACLQAFGERMREFFRRDSDALLRLGGEEFGVLMPDTSMEQARHLAEQFREDLANRGFQLGDQHLPVTTSLGLGCLDERDAGSAEAFFKRVDDALYRAKALGRDRLEMAQAV